LGPIPPQEYDGSPDAQAFYHFVRQGSAYIRAGQVPKDEQIFYLSYRLKAKASDFYEREVAKDESNWTLESFFWGLFEYCFPVDFRSKQRDKLNRCFQNQKSISEHTAEWEQILNMIGLEDNQEKVAKYWRSLAHEAKGAKTLEESVPTHYLEEFQGVFEKKEFNKLPE
jgi:hypothetical protein